MDERKALWLLLFAGVGLMVGQKGCDSIVPDPVDPPPIVEQGLHVLVVEESADRGKLPESQLLAITSRAVQEYVLASGGKYLMVDQDIERDGLLDVWKDAVDRPRDKLPWVVVSNGKTGFEGPLPAGIDETIELIKQYAE